MCTVYKKITAKFIVFALLVGLLGVFEAPINVGAANGIPLTAFGWTVDASKVVQSSFAELNVQHIAGMPRCDLWVQSCNKRRPAAS